ncbi:DoxX family protein [Macrococcus caseolyticus]|uniref:DoxX family protein n=1 Tax=Macrococcoides caseolyticum TaxID=69966 RepID=UPI0024BC224B|nr:DoxX family protein [Macrococcus caseolyticus]MDJ1153505.1 DoxX family protein [Macrococcus caseolyticus]
MHKHIVNGYVAKDILKSSLPKVKNDEAMAQQFKEGFNLSPGMMKVAGYFELIGSIFLMLSVFNKKFARIGAILINVVMLGAMYNHLKAGHGVKSLSAAGKYFGLNMITLFDSFKK